MLAKVNAHNVKLLLYELLNSIETNKGHVALAKQYRTQYDKLVRENESRRNSELEILKAEQKKSEGEQASRIMQAKAFQRSLYQKQKYKHIIVFSAISTLLLCLFILLYYRHVSSKKDTRNLVVREAMITISSNQFLDLITEKAVRIKDEQIGTEIINIADDLMQIIAQSPLLFHHYGKLYGKIREAHPELTSTECKIYWLYCTKALTIQEIFDLSGLSLDEFNQIWLSIDNKTAKK